MIGDILTQAGLDVVGEAETGMQAVEKYKAAASRSGDDGHHHAGDGRHRRREGDHRFRSAGARADVQRDGTAGARAEAIQAGAKDFVVKPFQPSRVLEAVQRVLG